MSLRDSGRADRYEDPITMSLNPICMHLCASETRAAPPRQTQIGTVATRARNRVDYAPLGENPTALDRVQIA